MANNKFMGTFDSETEVLRKIEDLKGQGISEDHMYVMAHDKDQLSMVRGRTDVDYKSAEGGWMDKFMGFLSGNEPVREAFSGMGVDDQEADRYYQDVQNGKILLFVDQEIGDTYSNNNTQRGSSVYGDPLNNTTGAAGYVGAADSGEPRSYGDSGTVARDGLTVDTNESNDINYHRDRGMIDSDDVAASRRLDEDETAGVGRDTGTGFGLGPGASVDGRSDRDVNDFSATNELESDRLNRRDDHATNEFRDNDFRDNDLESDRLNRRDDRTTNEFRDNDFRDNDLDRDATEEERLRLHEERLHVNKDRVQTGEVNVGKHVVESEQSIDVPVEREEVYVERRPVDEEVSGTDAAAYQEGDTIHIPLTEERVEVSKTDVVSEEIVVGKKKVQDTETVRETVRKEEADIDEGTTFNKRDDDLDDLDRNRKGRL
ncbi:DUF2382 domain-containing protein [Planococcus sp. FY231025]|uniref:DUF2382 domain-containing protein n=1 Tax=Planococcus sp. FY231025 TaxID=3455699 RepID=UPI003F8DF966